MSSNKQSKQGEDAGKALDDYMEWVMSLKGRIAFRGQADAEWELTTSAYRRLKQKMDEHLYAAHSIFVGYLHERINEVRMRFPEHREKTPLEVMAQLQHYGAATGLIDFTENPLVALWFACNEQSKIDGKVFAVRLDDSEKIREIQNIDELKGEKGGLDALFEKQKADNRLRVWRPGYANYRMLTQQSMFIFGKPKIDKELFLNPPYDVNFKVKETILHILEQFGISQTFMFPDFAGFSLSNSFEKDYDYTRGLNYYNEKIYAMERSDEE